ncbi:hypothetical protein AXX17_AT4G36920 [Arabidopsis thaliana]|uniref:Uncharacterized protein n=1 Tax=Arabidopsis thaliana TaxID=3702 RepID=A0A178UXA4_ARATH|nr:hypothetical protein AXX17_AT4G36920 [Arabidopsis thaliana]
MKAPSCRIIQVNIDESDPSRTVGIGSELEGEIKEELIAFLKSRSSSFAWSTKDMTGIAPEVTCHKLNTDPTFKPVRQKRRRLGSDRAKAVQDEVERLLKAGLIKEVQYPEWLANPVVVKKKNARLLSTNQPREQWEYMQNNAVRLLREELKNLDRQREEAEAKELKIIEEYKFESHQPEYVSVLDETSDLFRGFLGRRDEKCWSIARRLRSMEEFDSKKVDDEENSETVATTTDMNEAVNFEKSKQEEQEEAEVKEEESESSRVKEETAETKAQIEELPEEGTKKEGVQGRRNLQQHRLQENSKKNKVREQGFVSVHFLSDKSEYIERTKSVSVATHLELMVLVLEGATLRGSDCDLLYFTSRLVLGGNSDNAIGINVKCHFDLRDSSWRWWNAN